MWNDRGRHNTSEQHEEYDLDIFHVSSILYVLGFLSEPSDARERYWGRLDWTETASNIGTNRVQAKSFLFLILHPRLL
jgi:hypothetical protein